MNEELDIAAAEYVLGTLSAEERADFAQRLERDPALREAVARWQAQLSPLDDMAEAEAPPPAVWQRIDAATRGASRPAAAVSNVAVLRRRVALWRGAALVSGMMAAALAVVAIIDRMSVPEPAGGRYVAVVDAGGHRPALIAEVDTNTGQIIVRSLAAETPAGRSLELWHVAEGHAPRSLGVLQAGAESQTIRDAVSAGPTAGVIAVSVEPPGGSPSGAPTGPIVYTGELVPME